MHERMVDIMNCLAKYLRGNRSTSFGGLQVISGGDFFQLPPVVEDDEKGKAMSPSSVEWAFESGTWAKEKAVSAALLTRVFRQSDEEFVGILNKLRVGAAGAAGLRCWQRSSSFPRRRCTCGLCGSRWTRRIHRSSRVSAGQSVGALSAIPTAGFRHACAVCASAGDVMVGLGGAGIPKPS